MATVSHPALKNSSFSQVVPTLHGLKTALRVRSCRTSCVALMFQAILWTHRAGLRRSGHLSRSSPRVAGFGGIVLAKYSGSLAHRGQNAVGVEMKAPRLPADPCCSPSLIGIVLGCSDSIINSVAMRQDYPGWVLVVSSVPEGVLFLHLRLQQGLL
jgi:hypothetical protein